MKTPNVLVSKQLLQAFEESVSACAIGNPSILSGALDPFNSIQSSSTSTPDESAASADLLVLGVNPTDESIASLVQQARVIYPDIPILTVVDSLDQATLTRVMDAGSNDVITRTELQSQRLSLVLNHLLPSSKLVAPTPNENHDTASLQSRITTMQEEMRILQVLHGVTIEMMNRLELKPLLQHVADAMIELTNAEYSYIAMIHESGEYLETVAAGNGSEELLDIKHRRSQGVGGVAWDQESTIYTADYPNYRYKLPGISRCKQACGIPIKIAGETVGVGGIMYFDYDHNIEDKVEMLDQFAKIASVAIENATLHNRVSQELNRQEAISSLSRVIYGSASFDTLLDRVCVMLISEFAVFKAHVYKYEEGHFQGVVAWEKNQQRIVPAKQAESELVGQSICRWSIDNQQSAFVKRGLADERESDVVHQTRKAWNLGSTLCIPLVHNKVAWGVLFCHRESRQRDFNDSDIALIEIAAHQTSIAIHRSELLDNIRKLAYCDTLTGLPNRHRFENLLKQMIAKNEHNNSQLSLLFIDLDGFKAVNDTRGHAAGDQLLREVSTRFSTVLRANDVLARMGGDEFAVILDHGDAQIDPVGFGEQLLQSLEQDFEIFDASVTVGASIGISTFPADANTASTLLANADIAMYHAKDQGRGKVELFSHRLASKLAAWTSIQQGLKTALEEDQFELYYQPKVSIKQRKVLGVEALIRWTHPERGIISPFEFISVAEECGLITQIGNWVLNRACEQIAELEKSGLSLRVAINISAQQFAMDNFVSNITQVRAHHQLDVKQLELEVTESVVMEDVGTVAIKLETLRSKGITIAIDDFGTGYSSLQYLEDLPLDVLKIDRAFINKLEDGPAEKSLANAIILMAKSFNLKTVAEGVETDTQRRIVEELGCDQIQGYFYSKPVAIDELVATIKSIEDRLQSTPVPIRKAS